MRRARVVVCGLAVLGVSVVGGPATFRAGPANAATSAVRRLAGSVAPALDGSSGVGPVPGDQRRTIEVWMAGDQAAAARYAQAVSTPGSPSYRRFLSPVAYSQRFGPSADQVDAVRSFLGRAGFSQVHASVDDDYVSATGPVSTVDRAFAVQLRRYELLAGDGRPTASASNDRALTLPSTIGGDVLAVTGLTTGGASAPDLAAGGTTVHRPGCSRYWAQKRVRFSPAFDGLTRAPVAVCGYSAEQIRAAYALPRSPSLTTPTGSGRTIGLIEIGAPTAMSRTLTDYARVNGLPRPRRGQFREQTVGRGGACGNTGLGEEQLDSEAAYAMAPGADQIMFDGSSCFSHGHQNDFNQDVFDTELAPLTGRGSKASVDIESDCQSTVGLTASQAAIVLAIARRAADEGVSMLVASGDQPGAPGPLAGNPDVTAVGGTTLGIGARGRRLFETGWSDHSGVRPGSSGRWRDVGIGAGAGGGAGEPSPDPYAGLRPVYPEPSYQRGVVPDAMARNAGGELTRTTPDIAADADRSSGMLMGEITPRSHGRTSPYTRFLGGGTSMATPLVAGMIADAEQGQPADFGFLNPLLYSLSGSAAFNPTLPITPQTPVEDRAAYGTTTLYTRRGSVAGTQIEVFDDQDPGRTRQETAPGYDTMTGLGTPNGLRFIDALRRGR